MLSELFHLHLHLNFDSKGATLSKPETLQEAPQRMASDPETDLRVFFFSSSPSVCMLVSVYCGEGWGEELI